MKNSNFPHISHRSFRVDIKGHVQVSFQIFGYFSKLFISKDSYIISKLTFMGLFKSVFRVEKYYSKPKLLTFLSFFDSSQTKPGHPLYNSSAPVEMGMTTIKVTKDHGM